MNQALAFLLPCLVVLATGRTFIAILRDICARQVVREDGPATHLSKQGTPTMGGLILLAAASTGILAGASIRNAWPVLFVLWGYGMLGFWDDAIIVLKRRSLGLKARHKLLYQFLLAALALAIFYEGRFDGTLVPLLEAAFAMLVLVGTANAVNLTDGLDGLASGTLAVAFGAFAVIGWRLGHPDVAGISLALAGSCIGFLAFNRHPAAVFMGDTGSLGLGAALGMVGLMAGSYWLLVLVGLVFVAEALSVILQVIFFRISGGRRIFRMSPLHHHFELGGWEEKRVVLMFWAAGLLSAAVGIAAAFLNG